MGTCQVCGAQKKKCSKTFEAVHKSRKVAGSLHKTSESLQGCERADTIHVSMSVMWKLSILDVVKIRPPQHSIQVWKCTPSVEREGEPSDSSSLVKRQQECSPVHASPHVEGSPELEPPATHWDTPDNGEDVQMSTVQPSEGEMAGAVTEREGTREQLYCCGCLVAIGVELGNVMEALHDECIRVDEELACFNEEHLRRDLDLILDTLSWTLEMLQHTLLGLIGWEHATSGGGV